MGLFASPGHRTQELTGGVREGFVRGGFVGEGFVGEGFVREGFVSVGALRSVVDLFEVFRDIRSEVLFKLVGVGR